MVKAVPWLAAALLSGAWTSQDVPRFRAEVRRVFVDAFVTRDGKAVLGLTADDFELFDDGVRQDVQLVGTDAIPLSVLLVLDTSGSLGEDDRATLVEAARTLVAGLGPGDEIGLLTTTHRLELRLPLTEELRAMPQALDAPMARGATSIRDATFAGLTLLSGGRGRPLLIVLTDARDNASWLAEEDLMEAAGTSEAVLYVLAPESIASSLRRRHRWSGLASRREHVSRSMPVEGLPFFGRLARATGGDVLTVGSPEELDEAYEALLAQMKTRYLLVYEPENVSPEGWHELKVRLRDQRGEVRARPGYWAR